MTLWFCQRDNRTGVVKRRNISRLPSHTICAQGTGDSFASDYWIENDEGPMGVYYFSDNPSDYAGRLGKRFTIDKPSLTFMANGLGGDSMGHWHFAKDDRKDPDVQSDPSKPPYRVPLVSEIRKIRPNGLKVATTFAGAGGSSTGYRLAGFQVVWANEFVPIAQESYRANAMPYTVVDGRDIKEVTAGDILAATGLARGELDVFDGSPPCQAFSTAGKREKGWGTERHYEHGASQKNEELFFDYIRLRDGLMPKVFVAENVSGLVKGTAKGFFLEILKELRRGYRVTAPLLDAQWLGVPQARQRIVFIGVREDLGVDPPAIRPLPYRYSVRDALPWLENVVHDTRGSFKSGGTITDRPSVTIMSSAFDAHHFKVTGDAPSIEGQAIGDEYDKLNPGQQSDKYFSLVRADPDQPSPTITAAGGANAGIATVVHPTEKRKFSILEVKRLCGFPDDFELTGTYGQQWERLGNSVPPVMMQKIAEAIRDAVLIPARARTSGPAPRSAGRSTRSSTPKGGGKGRPGGGPPGATGKAQGAAPARTPARPRRPKGSTGGAAVEPGRPSRPPGPRRPGTGRPSRPSRGTGRPG